MLIDSHCHVLSAEYDDPKRIIEESFSKNVNKMIINGYDLESSKEAVLLANEYDNVYAAVGFGPENIDNFNMLAYKKIDTLLNNNKVVAVGEIGLDYYWTKENKNDQIKVFELMLKLAQKHNKPVIVHNRMATNDVYNLLKKHNVKGIIHCFSGSLQSAQEFINIGFLIGIGGVVTFKNAKKLKDVVKNIPLDKISLETDSPYLSPEPYRGNKNEPKNVYQVALKIAELKGVLTEEVMEKTSNNVMAKFDL